MLAPALAFLALGLIPSPPGDVFHGRSRQLDVTLPRLDASIVVDGVLNEPVWQTAARLTGFSQYQPVDQRPAVDSTDVLVWYSSTAIHFGIHAYSPRGEVNARLSDRDKIDSDDFVQIILGTFNDGRQAFVFGVNPLGVQADGTINEGKAQPAAGGGFGFFAGALASMAADLSANFAFDSKGRLTDDGYEVEVRIPFKSLRYQSRDVQDWGIQIVRQVQHLGYTDTWAPVRRDAASFLGQGGRLKGLQGLSRGLVVDITPSVVARQSGAEKEDGSWGYSPGGPEYGATVKWGITNNLSLNGTVNPDFSQVEADVVAFSYDPRQAISYPERRPFFLEGIENFSAPNGLIYTRSIVQPDVAVKLTGKTLGTNVALLQAIDDRGTSAYSNGHPFFNVLRATRDAGGQSRLGLTYGDRYDRGDYNRVLGIDARLVTRKIWTANLALAQSWTDSAGRSLAAASWVTQVTRAGRRYTFDAHLSGIGDDFRAQTGFISRAGIADGLVSNNWTFFAKPGSFLETGTVGVRGQETWTYDAFTEGRASQDRKLHFTGSGAIRGGWRASAGILFETFGFDPSLYADYWIERRVGATVDTVKLAGGERLHNFDLSLRVATPVWSHFSADFFYIGGQDENFDEWSSGLIHFVTVNARWRPSDQLRIEAQYQHQEFNRMSNHTTVNIRKVPRVKVEYQLTRSIFFRLVGQYDAFLRDTLRDDSRTNFPILLRKADGTFERADPRSRNAVRADWLFSYQPTPGTVFFMGYGSTLNESDQFRFRGLARQADGFFLKWSYLFRL